MERFLIPAKENDIQSLMDNHFGKSQWYLVVSSDGQLIQAIPGDERSHHTGIYHAKDAYKFSTILTPHMGPHAFEVANQHGLKIFMTSNGDTVLDAIRQYNDNELELLTSAEGLSCGGRCH
ncbi:MAG: NifB/NifX family molybdenum-iron cluster-binding protein [Candidatus Marinimicrobia bacterium]|nr:NifB/NifX family molybdenum-iron cluster-binding protein [Candidatus Neomarinimicrobiota bacterium]